MHSDGNANNQGSDTADSWTTEQYNRDMAFLHGVLYMPGALLFIGSLLTWAVTTYNELQVFGLREGWTALSTSSTNYNGVVAIVGAALLIVNTAVQPPFMEESEANDIVPSQDN